MNTPYGPGVGRLGVVEHPNFRACWMKGMYNSENVPAVHVCAVARLSRVVHAVVLYWGSVQLRT